MNNTDLEYEGQPGTESIPELAGPTATRTAETIVGCLYAKIHENMPIHGAEFHDRVQRTFSGNPSCCDVNSGIGEIIFENKKFTSKRDFEGYAAQLAQTLWELSPSCLTVHFKFYPNSQEMDPWDKTIYRETANRLTAS